MADTKTPLITLDTGKAITSLKEFKQYLDDLKGALLGLEKGSEDYNKVAKELRDGQQKLNDVMHESKKNSEALDGSYDALVEKMRDLRKEWRATSDDMKRQELGKEILGINDKLKELDASTGNFQRNVGNYSEAFSDAFEKALGPLGKMGGSLGTLSRDIKGMIPLIKSVNTTAIAGLKGIKAAIASTGIGLLVIAVGELAANWESVTKWIRNAITAQDGFADSLKNTETAIDSLNLKIAEFNKDQAEVEKQRKILFEGYSDITFAEERVTEAQDAQKKSQDNLIKATNERIEANKRLEQAQKWVDKDFLNPAAYAARAKAREEQAKAEENYNKALKGNFDAIQGVWTSEQNLTNAKKKEENATKNNTNAHKAAKSTYEGEAVALEDLIKRLNRYRREIHPDLEWVVKFQDLQDELKRDLKVIDDAQAKGVKITGTWEELKTRVIKMYSDKRKDLQIEENKARANEIKEGYEETIDWINNKLKNDVETFDLNQTLGERVAKILDKSKADSKLKTFTDDIKDSFNNIFGTQSTIFSDFEKKAKDLNAEFEINRKAAEDRIKEYENEIKRFEELQKQEEKKKSEDADYEMFDWTLTPEYLEAVQDRDNALMELDNLVTQNTIDNYDLIDERDEELAQAREARMQMIGISIQATTNLLNQFAKMQEQQIKDDVANGKISDKEAQKKFKRVKMLQKAAAVMETAQAAMGAYSSLASIPYVGPALGIAAAAAAVASGLMQIKQIDKTTLSSSSSSNLSTPDMNTVTNTYEPTYVTNMQSNSELSELANVVGSVQPVVSVVDINDAQNKVQVRDEESSF